MSARELGFMGVRMLAVYFLYAGFSAADQLSWILDLLRFHTGDMPDVAFGYWLYLVRIPVFIGLGAILWFQAGFFVGLVARDTEQPKSPSVLVVGLSAGCSVPSGWLAAVIGGWSLLDALGQPDRLLNPWLDAIGPAFALAMGCALIAKGRRAFVPPRSLYE